METASTAEKINWTDSIDCRPAAWISARLSPVASPAHSRISGLPEFTGVFRGRELTRKGRQIASGLKSIDNLISGGIVRGRISEIIALPGSGRTSLAAAFTAHVTRSEAVAWIDTSDSFDPAGMAEAGVELARLLWVSCRHPIGQKFSRRFSTAAINGQPRLDSGAVSDGWAKNVAAGLKAAEWILAAGGFGLVILDFGNSTCQLPQSAALRLARTAERSGAAVLVLAPHRMCGTFAALSLSMRCTRACFSRIWPGGPVLFDGLMVETRVARNKLGGSGRIAAWKTITGRSAEYRCPRYMCRPVTYQRHVTDLYCHMAVSH